MTGLGGLARRVVALAAEKGMTLGTAESLTGGMIASALAGVPGASRVLMGGIVSYDPRVKHELLGVSNDVISGPGVVSEPCAKQMAAGARERLGVDIAVSVTGLAGPGGGTPELPLGTVFLAIAGRGEPRALRMLFRGGRQAIRRKTVRAALEMIWDEMHASASGGC
jgi:PncC family amidohydrolase